MFNLASLSSAAVWGWARALSLSLSLSESGPVPLSSARTRVSLTSLLLNKYTYMQTRSPEVAWVNFHLTVAVHWPYTTHTHTHTQTAKQQSSCCAQQRRTILVNALLLAGRVLELCCLPLTLPRRSRGPVRRYACGRVGAGSGRSHQAPGCPR